MLLGSLSVYPRLWSTEQHDFIYWENILAHGQSLEYWEEFRSESAEGLARGLCVNIRTIASLCKHKYRLLRVATWLALLGGGMGAALLLLHR